MDITNGLENILAIILNIFISFFNMMENIEFMGTNLLQFNIVILIIGAIITVLFTIPKKTGERIGKAIRSKDD